MVTYSSEDNCVASVSIELGDSQTNQDSTLDSSMNGKVVITNIR